MGTEFTRSILRPGAETPVVTLDRTFNNALAFDENNVPYSILRTSGPAATSLYRFDLTTGTSTLVGNMGVSNISAIAFERSEPSGVPEPSSLVLLATGLLACAAVFLITQSVRPVRFPL